VCMLEQRIRECGSLFVACAHNQLRQRLIQVPSEQQLTVLCVCVCLCVCLYVCLCLLYQQCVCTHILRTHTCTHPFESQIECLLGARSPTHTLKHIQRCVCVHEVLFQARHLEDVRVCGCVCGDHRQLRQLREDLLLELGHLHTHTIQ
jgi:hypothetical protein